MTELALGTNLTPEQREYLTAVRASADSLLCVINDILDLSKIEAGKMTLEVVEFHLHEMVSDTLKTLSFAAQQKRLELLWDAGSNLPDRVIADPVRLRQVMTNLLGNAIKFTEAGEVMLQIEAAAPVGNTAELHFVVSDTGIGIPADRREHVFEAFVQGDGSSTRRFGGTGLGLTISTQLLRLMGGRIWVENRAGGVGGTSFHFTLPVVLAGGEATPAKLALPGVSPGLSALVVDDNATSRRILSDLLSRWGWLPELADSGANGLEKLSRFAREGKPFSLVLLDANMPEMDGFALAQHIGDDPVLSCPLVLMLNSMDLMGELHRAPQPGRLPFVVKPISETALHKAIGQALGLVPEQGKVASNPKPGLTTRPMRILVAEDNPVNQRLITVLLKKRGHSVWLAQNGREAVGLHANQPFDIIFMDVQMPMLNGHDASLAIRAAERTTGSRTPIIALTAHAMKGDREQCLNAGMDDYLTKPVRIGDLDAILDRFRRGVPRNGTEPETQDTLQASVTLV